MSNMQFEKSSTGASPKFDHVDFGYQQNPGHVNPDRANGAAGGEVRRETILERGGPCIKPSYTDLSGTR
jgi:hypothetical protein